MENFLKVCVKKIKPKRKEKTKVKKPCVLRVVWNPPEIIEY